MRVWISVDMEGISGLVRWADVVSAGIDFQRNRRLMTLDANAAIAGAFDAGAEEVVVEENHGVEDLCDLVLDEIDPRCRVVRGAGRPSATTMAGLTPETGVALFVGHHARAGSFPGIMAHTVSYERFREVRLAGAPIGESEIMTIRAGELGVPAGMVSGDQVVCAELAKRAPWIEQVCVKRALSNVAGDVIPPARAREMIREAAKRAVARARRGELAVVRGAAAPHALEVELRAPLEESLRANLAALPELEIVGDRLVRTLAPDMDLGFRRIAYLSFGHATKSLRY
jgi:D-amino peptidase